MRMAKSQKLIVLLASLIVGVTAYLCAHMYLTRDLTAWQDSQEMNLQQKTGSTKLKAYADSLTAGGVAFAFTAIILFAHFKRSSKKIEEAKKNEQRH